MPCDWTQVPSNSCSSCQISERYQGEVSTIIFYFKNTRMKSKPEYKIQYLFSHFCLVLCVRGFLNEKGLCFGRQLIVQIVLSIAHRQDCHIKQWCLLKYRFLCLPPDLLDQGLKDRIQAAWLLLTLWLFHGCQRFVQFLHNCRNQHDISIHMYP